MNQWMHRWPPAALLALLVAAAPGASGWVGDPEEPHHALLAVQAVELLPTDLRDAMLAHKDALMEGANSPDASVDPFFHRYDPADPEWGGAVAKADESYAAAVAALRDGDARLGAYWLGYMSHFILDVAQPMHSGNDEGIGHRYHAEYEGSALAHADELTIRPRSPLVERDGADAALWSSRQAAARWPALDEALLRANGPWSDEAARITQEALSDGLLATAGAMAAAVAEAGWEPPASAAEPAPVVEAEPAGEPDVAAPPARSAESAGAPAGSSMLIGGLLVLAGALAGLMSKRVPKRTRGRGDDGLS